MKGLRAGIAIVGVAAVTGAIGAGAALTGGEPQWKEALQVRSEALNRQHGLSEPSTSSIAKKLDARERSFRAGREQTATSMLDAPYSYWRHGLGRANEDASIRALELRSEALNRMHGLGKFARKPAGAAPAWLRALIIRSDALNRQYKLGEYAPGS